MPYLSPPVGAAATRVAALHALIPTITTERLVLRPSRIDDWPTLSPIWTAQRAVHIGGPFSPEDAWTDFNQVIAGWLLRGHGGLTITRKTDGTILGLVLLGHEFGDPEPELGWLLTADAEGHGFATEAARALRDWGQEQSGLQGFVSYIASANTASAAVAARLGAVKSGTHPLANDVDVYRYGGGK